MGEKGDKKEKENKEGENKKNEEGIELKFDMHCAGCANKVKKIIKSNFQGVDKVSVDLSNTKLKVMGNVDPWKLKELIESKTKKKVDLISPVDPPKKKDDAGSDNKPAKVEKEEKNKPDEKAESDEKKSKQLPASTVLLKIRLHCDGCIDRIKRSIHRIKGVDEVIVDKDKNVVTVKGTMDVKSMPEYLQNKFKRSVEIVNLPNKDDKKDDEKEKKKDTEKEEKKDTEKEKEKKKEGGNAKATAAESSNAAARSVPEVNKMEYRSLGYANGYEQLPSNVYAYRYEHVPMNGYTYGYEHLPSNGYTYSYEHEQANGYEHMPANGYQHLPANTYGYYHEPFPANGYVNGHDNGYGNYGYSMVHAPQMFSDENPNACSVM